MALDHILQEEKYISFKSCRNIGNTFVNIGKYCDLIQNYEYAMSFSTDHETGINAFLCYVVLGCAVKSKRSFTKIISLPLNKLGEEEVNFTSERNICKGGDKYDDLLEQELLRRSKAD